MKINIKDIQEILVTTFVVIIFMLMLSGCTSHEISVSSPTVEKLLMTPPPRTCRTVNLPEVPETANLSIKGNKVAADQGGDTLLRGYVACRSMGVAVK